MMNLLFGTPFTVSTHSRPKAAGTNFIAWARAFVFQLTAARRRLVNMEARQKGAEAVSTHSRPKAAGWIRKQQALALKRFNSQPPEGGWDDGEVVIVGQQFRFNSQPPEGGWGRGAQNPAQGNRFNSQPPEGGWSSHLICLTIARNRFNSQPPEGGWFCTPECANNVKRFNSQPPEGGWASLNLCRRLRRSFNSQPPEGGWFITCWAARVAAFQLTAARRRLVTVTCLC